MRGFEFIAPADVSEALEVIAQRGDEAKVVAGGTSLVLLMKERLAEPETLVSLQRVRTLAGISQDESGMHLGSLLSHREIEMSDVVRRSAPLLSNTLRQVATVRIRNQATIGGNLAHADPALDPPASLIALDSTVRLVSTRGERVLPLDDFYLDYYETRLEPDELLDEIFVPHQPAHTGGAYLKFLPRTTDDYGTVGVAARLTLDDSLDRVEEARIVLSNVAPTVVRMREAEQLLVGQRPNASNFEEAAALATRDLTPATDTRGSGDYKREMAGVFVRRSLDRAFEEARGNAASDNENANL